MIERAMAARGNRALLLIDLGVPRNVAADAADLYNTYLYNIDDLTEIVEQNKKAREAEIPTRRSDHRRTDRKIPALAGGSDDGRGAGRPSRQARRRARSVSARASGGDAAIFPSRTARRLPTLLKDFVDRVVLDPAERLRGIPELRRKLQNLEALRDLFRLDREKP